MNGSEIHSPDTQDLHQQCGGPLVLFGISRKIQPLKKKFLMEFIAPKILENRVIQTKRKKKKRIMGRLCGSVKHETLDLAQFLISGS